VLSRVQKASTSHPQSPQLEISPIEPSSLFSGGFLELALKVGCLCLMLIYMSLVSWFSVSAKEILFLLEAAI